MSEERERRYISEYCMEQFPQGNYALNVPLGRIPKQAIEELGLTDAAAQLRPFRRRIDAVAWTPSHYLLIEAKIRDALEGLGRLQTYRDLAKFTPDLPGYLGQEFQMWLVVPWALDWVQVATAQAGIKIQIYWRDWISQYVTDRQRYFTAEYRRARAEKQHMRRILGVE